jgi:ankyrin repeat protein
MGGVTPLHLACSAGHVELVKLLLLLQHSPNINARV